MKIGILTFHRAANYGAVLQAYALQNYLSSIGHDVGIIDYRCEPIEQMHSPNYFLFCKGMKNKCKQLLRSPIKRKKRKLFDRFIERRLNLGETKKMNKEDISQALKGKYDMIIAGSDQIWNPYLTNGDCTYLLDFADKNVQKVSYAASIGLSELPKEYLSCYREHLSEFDKISVRETQGQSLVREVAKRDSEVVLDPTLLISADEWKEFLESPAKDGYVLLYTIKSNPMLLEKATSIAKEKNLSVIYISDTMVRQKGITYVPYATPEEWVGLFAGAEHVVTNSFHGTAFSVNFNKAATIALSRDKNNGNSRIVDLMESLGIEKGDDYCIEIGASTDWKLVNDSLSKLREQSKRFFDVCNL